MGDETNTHPDNKPGKIGGKEATASHSSPTTNVPHVSGQHHKAMNLSSPPSARDILTDGQHLLGSYQVYAPEPDDTRWASAPHKSSASMMEDVGRAEKRQRLNPIPCDTLDQCPRANSPTSRFGQAGGAPPGTVGLSSIDQSDPRASRDECDNCLHSDRELPQLIKALVELQVELGISTADETNFQNHERTVSEVTKHGLGYGLTWAVIESRKLLGCVQGATSATVPLRILPPLDEVVAAGKSRQDQVRIATHSHEADHASYTLEKASLDQHARISHDRSLYSSKSLPPIIPPDEMKRNRQYDQPPTASTASPYPSSGSSVYAPSHSPAQSHGGVGRSLPSPPGMYLPPTSLSSTGIVTTPTHPVVHASHLQDLQHQISTKTLALQTLQREHDQLLAAFSRSQIRCSTLDKKSRVSDYEINHLTEEKIRLEKQVEVLESHIEDLTKARDEFQKQSTADGEQWRRIMAMSSQLQARSASEARMHKLAKDEWQRERDKLERRIRTFESGNPIADTTHQSGAMAAATDAETATEDVLYSTSLEALREEIGSLRRRCMELEAVLHDVTGETEQLGQAMKAMANIRARISGQSRDHDEDQTA